MQRVLIGAVAAMGALVCAPAAKSQGVSAATTTQVVNVRAGPQRDYPVVAVLGPGTPVHVYGCVRDYAWCDIDAGRVRGWAYAQFLASPYESRPVPLIDYGAWIGLPVIVFSIGYWDQHYRGRPWYRDRPHWAHRPPPPMRPRPPPRPPGADRPPPPAGDAPGAAAQTAGHAARATHAAAPAPARPGGSAAGGPVGSDAWRQPPPGAHRM